MLASFSPCRQASFTLLVCRTRNKLITDIFIYYKCSFGIYIFHTYILYSNKRLFHMVYSTLYRVKYMKSNKIMQRCCLKSADKIQYPLYPCKNTHRRESIGKTADLHRQKREYRKTQLIYTDRIETTGKQLIYTDGRESIWKTAG